ncbi:MAG: outer membrane protein assembly factor BamD [Cryomorphaceae bacterium]
MKRALFTTIVLLSIALSSCTEYRKVLKSDDMQYKYDMALEYYKDGKVNRAYPLFEELYIVYRGTDKGERIAYYQAKSDFKLRDYILAGHRFSQFYRSYPNSEYSEETQFLSAYCNYKLSPKWSLDQRDTERAIRSLQLFAIDHPESSRIDSCNLLLDELRFKLEFKEYKAAKLFYRMEKFRAAQRAFANFNQSYPSSRFREEAYFLEFKSGYLLAINSVDDKKVERIEEAMDAYVTFVDRFPGSKDVKEAEQLYSELATLLQRTKKIS